MLIMNTIRFRHLKNGKKVFLRFLSKTVTPVPLASTSYESATSQSPGTPFIVIHGLFGSRQNWATLCKAYSQQTKPPRRVIALDMRNHGDSPHSEEQTYRHLCEDVRHFLVSSNIEKSVLMGHSMGGMCAMLFALTYPESLDRLIVVDVSPVSAIPNLNAKLAEILENLLRVELPKNVSVSEARTMVDFQLAQDISDKALRSFLLKNLVATEDMTYKWKINIPTLLRSFYKMAQFPTVNGTYDGDTLFIGGENSKFIPKSDYSKITKLFPKAELKYIENAGHWVHAEKPNEFLKLTLEFLNKN